MNKKFKDLVIGATFYCNGNLCKKKSTRTAFIDYPKCKLWFYFGLHESVRQVAA